ISGVDVNLVVGSDIYTMATDSTGKWSRDFTFEFDSNNNPVGPYPLNFTACEETPLPSQWIETGPNAGAFTATSVANNARCWVGSTVDNDMGLNFGNVCYGVPGQGLTLGYWHNKNGKATMVAGNCLPGVLGLPLRNANGFLLGSVGMAQFQAWLINATATNMA